MKLALDTEACVGHGRCYALAADIFDADDRGHCVIQVSGEIPPEVEAVARTGVDNCPENALRLVD
jgi:ferredoxin